ncbi:GNAT family N-acetyltransferase [Stenotrophomonas indicatrix]|uniref:GNAT family N-acetyltransferase n=1 Tax=Stenotrophomonas indicatrix TaxID=2045451 RepID=UPI001CBE9B3B|nr:GNAT family N-acetyltransferase [Stenotrophomonas indicatrix]
MERADAPAAANAEDARELCALLSAFNRASSGFDFEDVPVRLAWRDEQGELRGGLLADVCAGWLQVHVLWVDPERRGRGIGQRLLADAETQARDAGACGVMLDTFD